MIKLEQGAGVTAGAPGPCFSLYRARGGDYLACTKAEEQVWANTSPGFAGTDYFW